jgi:hypothetical protein
MVRYIMRDSIVIAGAGYVFLLRLCDRGENKLLGVPGARGEKIKKIIPMVRRMRYGVVAVATVGEVLIVLSALFSKPLFDCSKCCL